MYFALYWGCCLFVLCTVSFYFIPSSTALRVFGPNIAHIGNNIFFILRTLLVIPIFRFIVGVFATCFSQSFLLCTNPREIITFVIAVVSFVMLFIASIQYINHNHSLIELSKKVRLSLFDERSKLYHQYAFLELVLFSILSAKYSLPPLTISIISVLVTLMGVSLYFAFEPYEDCRVLCAFFGGLCCGCFSNILGLASVFYPYNEIIMISYSGIPLIFFIGYRMMIFRRKINIRSLFKSNTSFFLKYGSFSGSRECDLSQMEDMAYMKVQKAFRGSYKLFVNCFLPLLAKDKFLVKLDASINEFSTNDFFSLISAIQNHRGLRELYLSRNSIEFSTIQRFQYNQLVVFLQNSRLELLDISQNPITDRGFDFFANAFLQSENKRLNYINFSYCDLTHNSGKKISLLLEEKKTRVKSLILRGNKLGATGIKYISQGLFGNQTLKTIDLSWNNIAEGVEFLIRALKQNFTLQEIKVGSNGICKYYLHMLLHISSRNSGKKLSYFLFSGSRIARDLGGGPGMKKIADLFYANVLRDKQTRKRFAKLKIEKMRYLLSNYLLSLFSKKDNFGHSFLKRVHENLEIVRTNSHRMTTNTIQLLKSCWNP